MDNNKRKTSVALLSVVSNGVLVTLKLAVGVAIGSVSVISEAIHSGVDLLAAVIALYAVRTSGQPADEQHPFGHGKVENISGTVEALLIFFAACWIVYEAARKLAHPEPIEAAGWGVGVMLVSAVVNIVISGKLFKVGKETDSLALKADAWHLRTDVYTSAGVMASLLAIWVGEWVFPGRHLHWLDPVAAIAVALLIVKSAYSVTVESGRGLMDTSLPPEEEEIIREHVMKLYPVVRGFHRLRTRKSGPDRFALFHVLVSGEMSVEESHRLNDRIVNSIREHLPGCTVHIHMEPCGGDCERDCKGCLMGNKEEAETRAKDSADAS